MRVQADRRSRDVVPCPAAEQAAREGFREIARAEEKTARALATIERHHAHVRHGFASVQSWAADVGYGPQQANRLLALGRTLLDAPALAPKVRTGRVPAEAVISVGRVLREPTLELNAAEREAWIEKVETAAPRALRAEVEQAVEEARQGRPTCPLRLRVTLPARDGFRRARGLMSKGKRRAISEGEAFGRLVVEWLVSNDPRLRPLPRRCSGPTAGRKSRAIPARVRALVERRSGGDCEICGFRRATQMMHIRTPHALGGGQEVEDLAHGCPTCHTLLDSKVYSFTALDADGRLQWDFHPGALDGEGGPTRVREGLPAWAFDLAGDGSMLIRDGLPLPYR